MRMKLSVFPHESFGGMQIYHLEYSFRKNLLFSICFRYYSIYFLKAFDEIVSLVSYFNGTLMCVHQKKEIKSFLIDLLKIFLQFHLGKF